MKKTDNEDAVLIIQSLITFSTFIAGISFAALADFTDADYAVLYFITSLIGFCLVVYKLSASLIILRMKIADLDLEKRIVNLECDMEISKIENDEFVSKGKQK